ncbi:LysR family transcriptional regulator [Ectothiorhodospiraceae bacterium WFHF3C12]|nr:LysR family transcriptional regulator [Ectothiorhodospiraceae bacterium WFHF3C12]
MTAPRISLEQWRALVAVVDTGGYANAAEALNKSQSTISYAVRRIEELLGVALFTIEGRKAVLTAAGRVLYRRARTLVEEAGRVEAAGAGLAGGWEAELRVAVEILFPTWLLLRVLDAFAREHPEMRIQLFESVLGGTEELLEQREVDLAVTGHLPASYAADPIRHVRFRAVAAPSHPLHNLGRSVALSDLRAHRHIVIRDTGVRRTREGAWDFAGARLTVTNKATSIRALTLGMGFAWVAEDIIREELDSGALKPLPLRHGAERWGCLYLVQPDPDAAGPGAQRLATLIRKGIAGLNQGGAHPAG